MLLLFLPVTLAPVSITGRGSACTGEEKPKEKNITEPSMIVAIIFFKPSWCAYIDKYSILWRKNETIISYIPQTFYKKFL